MRTTRRRLLASAGATAALLLAGCASPGAGTTQTTLRVQTTNRSGAEQTFALRVTDDEGTVVVDRPALTVAAGVSQPVERTGLSAESYTIRVTGDGWATSGVWNPEACPDYTFRTTLDGPADAPAVTASASCANAQ